MKRYFFTSLIITILLSTQFGFSSTSKDSSLKPLTQAEMRSAIAIPEPNARSIIVESGKQVIYHVSGTELYIKVSNNPAPEDMVTAAIWSATQVCGIHVYSAGLPVADLGNRANVSYYTSIAKAPAMFNWYDMSGTKTIAVGYSWSGLSQTSSPSVGVKFNSSGWVQSQGTLSRCLAGICGTQGVFVSYVRVNTSKTYCQ